MKSVSGKAFARTIERCGWKLQRINGSHHIYINPEISSRISVLTHGNTALKIGLLRHLMKLAEISEDQL